MAQRWNYTDERELYMRGIELLCDSFREKGVKPTIGQEYELHVIDKDNLANTSPLGKSDNELNPLLERMHGHLNAKLAVYRPALAFKEAEPVAEIYKENPAHKYEVVSGPLWAEQAVPMLEQMQKEAHDAIFSAADGKHLKVNRNAVESLKKITPALHTNIGFRIGGKDAFISEDINRPNPKVNYIANHMSGTLRDLQLLFAPKPSSYTRYNCGNKTSPTHCDVAYGPKDKSALIFRFMHWDGHSSSRIENRLPGSDTHVYKAVLGTLLSAHKAFDEVVELDRDGRVVFDAKTGMKHVAQPEANKQKLAADISEAALLFNDSKPLWDMLDKLSPGEKIGSKIYQNEIDRYKYIVSRKSGSSHDGAQAPVQLR